MRKQNDLQFLARRKRLAVFWNAIGTLLIIILVGLLGWLFLTTPYLVNPVYVSRQILAGTVERSTLEFMAMLLPFVVLAIFAVIGAVIGFGFAVFSNERRYHRMIDNLHTTLDKQRT